MVIASSKLMVGWDMIESSCSDFASTSEQDNKKNDTARK
jgi:hypothetical protein